MDLSVNLADPDELQARMPEIRELYEAKQAELQALSRQVAALRRLVGDAPPTTKRRPPAAMRRRVASVARAAQNAPGQDRAVAALEQFGQPAGPSSLFRWMTEQGMETPNDANTLGSNLWAAWKAGRVMKAPNGVYTPLDDTGNTEWDRPLTDYYEAQRKGFNVPPARASAEGSPGP
jgi:hypothetical protein